MKSTRLIAAAAAVLAAAACSQSGNGMTAISGTFEENSPEEVTISVPSQQFDTTVAVTDGKFSISVPADVTGQAVIKAGQFTNHFVSDGTALTFSYKADKSVEIASSKPEKSVQVKREALNKAYKELNDKFMPEFRALEDKEGEEAYALIDSYNSKIREITIDAFTANKDNIITVEALKNLRMDDMYSEKMDSLLGTISPSLDAVPEVAKIREVVDALKKTAEGQMFTDFTIGEQKLSDYVGKGKYVLVDFWASWCGPCRGEIPNIANVYKKYAGESFDVLSVSVWVKKEDTVKAAEELGITWSRIDGDNERNATTLDGIQGIPHIILFGPDGTILKRNLRGEAIEAEVAKYVK